MRCYRDQLRCAAAFGCGLLIASLCPCTVVIVVSAFTVIIISFGILRR